MAERKDVCRSSNALYMRHSQLVQWDTSVTAKEPTQLRRKTPKIKFHDGCVFLAACSSGDIEEVTALLNRRADINTTNVDGLTALHQAVIDNSMKMGQFLVEQGANLDALDNEGWTPLHAASSCGFLKMAKFLMEAGVNICVVNSDGDLALDVAESDEMENLINSELSRQGIDVDAARNEEQNLMLADARQWLNLGAVTERVHPVTKATALHVAASKGYINVMILLLQAGANTEAQDLEGWTPLHAAVYWGQRDACEVLAMHRCSMRAKDFMGQTAFDIADSDIIMFLLQLQSKQSALSPKPEQELKFPRQILPVKRRTSLTRMSVVDKSHVADKEKQQERSLHNQKLAQHDLHPIQNGDARIASCPEPNNNRITPALPSLSEENHAHQTMPRISEVTGSTSDKSESSRRSAPVIPGDMANLLNQRVRQGVPGQSFPANPAVGRDKIDQQEQKLGWRRTDGPAPAIVDTQPEVNNNLCTPTQSVGSTLSIPEETSEERERRLGRPTRSLSLDVSPQTLGSKDALIGEAPITGSSGDTSLTTRPIRSLQPPSPDDEAETVRRSKSRLARQTRRSTQGITAEDVAEAQARMSQLRKTSQQQTDQQDAATKEKQKEVGRSQEKDAGRIQDNVEGQEREVESSQKKDVGRSQEKEAVRSQKKEEEKQAELEKKKEVKPKSTPLSTFTAKLRKQESKEKKSNQAPQSPARSYTARLPLTKRPPPASTSGQQLLTVSALVPPARKISQELPSAEVSAILSLTPLTRRKQASAPTPDEISNSVTIQVRRPSLPVTPTTTPSTGSGEGKHSNKNEPSSANLANKKEDGRQKEAEEEMEQRFQERRRTRNARAQKATDNAAPSNKDVNRPDTTDLCLPEENIKIKEEVKDQYKSLSERYRARFASDPSPASSERATPASRPVSSSLSSYEQIENESKKDYKKLYEEEKRTNEDLKDKLRTTDADLQAVKKQLEELLRNGDAGGLDVKDKRITEKKMSELEEEVKQLEKLKAENTKLKEENRALTRVVSKLSK
ncbi:PREDICTED: protein phosphatase 1 regulatory subunit 12A-like isoform X1 [Priapulus caudatus]|uniref:Protein phosphatase 1 regulatory subunit 12A-like isoform X1 n=1 Tax=Priapulus caudatus TaxID=37621 RepID=A0ABM1EK39_PRICU|nr:PREDICTED: protein phosphatase 1 regulatory subunit 12A-like isoform X1 [Priapulus caudatus]